MLKAHPYFKLAIENSIFESMGITLSSWWVDFLSYPQISYQYIRIRIGNEKQFEVLAARPSITIIPKITLPIVLATMPTETLVGEEPSIDVAIKTVSEHHAELKLVFNPQAKPNTALLVPQIEVIVKSQQLKHLSIDFHSLDDDSFFKIITKVLIVVLPYQMKYF